MGYTFEPVDRDTPTMFPASVQDYVPQKHLARHIVEIVEMLDIRPIENAYAGRGSKAYHPRMLLALLIYGYSQGIFSSRKLEKASIELLPMRYICANLNPVQLRKHTPPHIRRSGGYKIRKDVSEEVPGYRPLRLALPV